MPGFTFTEESNVANSIYGNHQYPIRAFLEERGEAFEQQSQLPHLFTMETSTHWAESYGGLTSMSEFEPVGENGPHPMNEMREGYQKVLKHMTWKSRFDISREMIDDGNVIDMKKRPLGFMKAWYRTRENFGAALFGNAILGNTSFTMQSANGAKVFDCTSADSLCLFSTAHTSALGNATQSNRFADAISAEAVGAVETEMQNFKGDNGEILDIAPMTLLIPNDMATKKAAFAAVGSHEDPEVAGSNAFSYVFGRWNIIVWPYLNKFITGNDKPWVMLDTAYSEQMGGAVWLDRVKLEVKSKIDDNTDANKWLGYARFIAGFNDWRFAAVGGVTGGTQLITT